MTAGDGSVQFSFEQRALICLLLILLVILWSRLATRILEWWRLKRLKREGYRLHFHTGAGLRQEGFILLGETVMALVLSAASVWLFDTVIPL
ncbi:hypothetical protein [Pantoea sp. At-9b]|uniref:hypothetical protein n=1 Tax=Pantoea sp. (strain At-9b) TaxID=592316 RepID=UPI0001B3F889|nr:hypothetical protein [Pantoea sp. At-9b]ADU73059.1 hypothetical protein Pat9b_4079 [Pantoea sp. At-9b]